MNKLSTLLSLVNDDILFDTIKSSFISKITKWNYFVDWAKVYRNIKPIEIELNILNYLIGKGDIENETFDLIKKYPQIVKALPLLIATREKSFEVLIDVKTFLFKNYNFSKKSFTDDEFKELASFVINSGLGELLKDEKVKNLVDYVTGVEVGLDSNTRKNRVGTLMEGIVEDFVLDTCTRLGLKYLSQATAKKIKDAWGIEILVDKSSRQLDFAINNKGILFFIECNFYGGGGSKLKSTATEYVGMNRYWNTQGIEFIWITDGGGWKSTLKPLREYFDKADYLLNLQMLKDDVLFKILK